mgnify:CR=1 FL=1
MSFGTALEVSWTEDDGIVEEVPVAVMADAAIAAEEEEGNGGGGVKE